MSDRPRLALGPSAESFHEAFGVGAADQLNPVDGVGVALAAIQGLHGLIDGQARDLTGLRERIEKAERRASVDGDSPGPSTCP